MMCDGLKLLQKRAFDKDLTKLYDLVLSGNEGREYLRRGRFRRASQDERFRKYLAMMRKDAAPFAATSKWTRFWCTDSELIAIATIQGIAIVCVETTDNVNAAAKSPFFVAVPPLPPSNNTNRLGKYYADGELDVDTETVTWRSQKKGLEFTLRCVHTSSAQQLTNDASSSTSGVIPAICVKHFPGHFEALVPERPDTCLLIDWRSS